MSSGKNILEFYFGELRSKCQYREKTGVGLTQEISFEILPDY